MDEINISTEYKLISDFESLRNALNYELHATSQHFCKIGYLLKRARDENMLEGSSYSSVNEFASAEFGLDASQVSRFIRINDRFSIDGYSDQLKTEYENYGSAKLSLMLMLPDAINEELSPDMSKAEINTVKAEYEVEQKISDIEVMMEDASDVPDEFIMAIVHELNDENPDTARYFNGTMKLAEKLGLEASEADIKEAYTPEGQMTYIIRIPGQGRFMVSMKTEGITITNVRDPQDKSPLTWPEFLQAVFKDMENRDFSEVVEEKAPEKKRKTEKVKPAKPKKEKIVPVQGEDVQNDTENVQKDAENDRKQEETVKTEADNDQTETQDDHEEIQEEHEAVVVEGEIVQPGEITSAQQEAIDRLARIEELVVPENHARAQWKQAYEEVQDLARYIKQFTY